jgi:hypothetical protein
MSAVGFAPVQRIHTETPHRTHCKMGVGRECKLDAVQNLLPLLRIEPRFLRPPVSSLVAVPSKFLKPYVVM